MNGPGRCWSLLNRISIQFNSSNIWNQIRSNNGDTNEEFKVGKDTVVGLGSYHKTLPHNDYGEVCPEAFKALVDATQGNGIGFDAVPKGGDAAQLTNPQGGHAADQLTHHPAAYSMPPAPAVLSISTAAEMTELYWMALLRNAISDTNSLWRDGLAAL